MYWLYDGMYREGLREEAAGKLCSEPPGMSAAKIAAERGHQIWLYEQRNVPGGQLRVASIYDGKSELKNI